VNSLRLRQWLLLEAQVAKDGAFVVTCPLGFYVHPISTVGSERGIRWTRDVP